MKLFPARLWAGNIAESLKSVGNSTRYPLMLTDDLRNSDVQWIFSFKSISYVY